MSSGLLLVIGISLLVPATVARLVALAPTRLGAVFYFANIASDTLWKRAGLPRGSAELVLFAMGLGAFLLAREAPLAAIAALTLALVEVSLRGQQHEIMNAIYGHHDRRRRLCAAKQTEPEHAGALPGPSVHPDLVINVDGPFVTRTPRYNLGSLPIGRELALDVVVANHSLMPGQVPIEVNASLLPAALELLDALPSQSPPLEVGGVWRCRVRVRARQPSGECSWVLTVTHADCVTAIPITIRSVFEPGLINSAAISRYPGGARSAFAWRGDMDLYDRSNFQSIEGLRATLGLAARYRFPQTLYLSTRLSLDAAATRRFQEHFGVERGHQSVDDFVAFLRDEVTLAHELSYPTPDDKPYALELGNHMHLHYGTDAAAAAGNDWLLAAGINAGRYPWQTEEQGSLEEQRDNAMAARRLMEDRLDFTPKSWAMPDSTNDANTPAAVEAAGCEVTSDADASHWHNVISQPPPHHPAGTKVVELTKRYPGDPQDYVHYAMFLYWLHRGHRLGIPVIYMAHHHLRLYEGHACTRFTEAVMRYVLTEFRGDLHVNTVFGIGVYWREVLSENRRVSVEVTGDGVVVRNNGDVSLTEVPVDVRFVKGGIMTLLVDLPAGVERRFDALGNET